MNRTVGKGVWSLGVLGAVLLTVPPMGTAEETRGRQSDREGSQWGQSEQAEQTTSFFSPDYVLVITPVYIAGEQDRSRIERMVQELETLPVGKSREFYRQALERRGYRITESATRGNRTQFGARKNGQDMVLTVRFDEETGKSTQVSAFPLLITAAREGEASQRSPSARRSGGARQLVRELESLPTGREEQFYRRALRDRGYDVIDHFTSDNTAEFEVEKDGQVLALTVNFDEETGKSTSVEAAPVGEQPGAVARSGRRERFRQDMRHEEEASQRQMTRRTGPASQPRARAGQDETLREQVAQELESLPVGRDRQFYRQALRERGYESIRTTLNTDDTLHLEAEKDGLPVTLAVSFDEETGRSTEVAAAVAGQRVIGSSARAERTAMAEETRGHMRRPQRFSDRDQARAARLVEELESLPVGRDKQFYRQALQQRGYEITDTTIWADRVEYEIEKNGYPIALTVQFDDQSGESTRLEAAPLWWDTAQERTRRGEKSGDAEKRKKFDQAGAREVIEEIEALPVGRERQFYLKALEQRGYRIPATYIDTEDQLQLEAVKDGQRAVVTVKFDDATGRSTEVYASPLGERGLDTSQVSSSERQFSRSTRGSEAQHSAEEEMGRHVRTEHQGRDDY